MTPPTVTGAAYPTLTKITACGISAYFNVAGNANVAKLTAAGGAGTYTQPGVSTIVSNAGIIKTGLVLGGAGAIEVVTPDTIQVFSEGGFILSSEAVISFVLVEPPTITAISTSIGFRLGGLGKVRFYDARGLTTSVVSSGGFVLGGISAVTRIGERELLTRITALGGFALGGAFSLPVVPSACITLLTSSGGFVLGGGGKDVASSFPSVVAVEKDTRLQGDLRFGGRGLVVSLAPAVDLILSEGGLMLGGLGVTDQEIYNETWAMNGFNMEPSLYTGWTFNSFGIFQGRAYGAKEDGIYVLEGTDDDGAAIITGVRLGPANFGTDLYKRLRVIRTGETGNGVSARVETAGKERIFPHEEAYRIPMSRDLQGKEFIVDIQGFSELAYLEIVPLILWKK